MATPIEGLSSVESDILATHIDPFVATDSVTTTTDTLDAPAEAALQDTPEPTTAPTVQPSNGGAGVGDGKDAAAKPGTQETPTGNPRARHDGATEDEKGGLKLTDGTYIKPGAHRRLYEENTTLKLQTTQVGSILQRVRDEIIPAYDRDIASLTAKVQAYEGMATLDKQYNLQPTEVTEAVKMMAAYKANPLATLQYMLAEAKAAGHNIDGIGSGVDTLAIQRMIDARLGPITADREQQQRATEIQSQAATAATQFFNKFPDAKVHEGLIAKAISDNPNLSPESAYYELKIAAVQRGLDWAQPLLQQMQAATTRGSGGQPTPTQAPVPVTLPSGRASTPAVSVETPRTYNDNASFGDIVRDAMREAGLKV